MHDADGNELAVGDRVSLEFEVTGLTPGAETCNIALSRAEAGEQAVFVTCQAQQVVKGGRRAGVFDNLWLVRDLMKLFGDAAAQNWVGLAADVQQLIADWRAHHPAVRTALAGPNWGGLIADVEKLIADAEAALPDLERVGETVLADIRAIAADLGFPLPV